MGNQSQRKREAACAAERRAKKEAAKSAETISAQVDSAVPADNAVPAMKQTKSALQKQKHRLLHSVVPVQNIVLRLLFLRHQLPLVLHRHKIQSLTSATKAIPHLVHVV